jgi:hypothetical protein
MHSDKIPLSALSVWYTIGSSFVPPINPLVGNNLYLEVYSGPQAQPLAVFDRDDAYLSITLCNTDVIAARHIEDLFPKHLEEFRQLTWKHWAVNDIKEAFVNIMRTFYGRLETNHLDVPDMANDLNAQLVQLRKVDQFYFLNNQSRERKEMILVNSDNPAEDRVYVDGNKYYIAINYREVKVAHKDQPVTLLRNYLNLRIEKFATDVFKLAEMVSIQCQGMLIHYNLAVYMAERLKLIMNNESPNTPFMLQQMHPQAPMQQPAQFPFQQYGYPANPPLCEQIKTVEEALMVFPQRLAHTVFKPKVECPATTVVILEKHEGVIPNGMFAVTCNYANNLSTVVVTVGSNYALSNRHPLYLSLLVEQMQHLLHTPMMNMGYLTQYHPLERANQLNPLVYQAAKALATMLDFFYGRSAVVAHRYSPLEYLNTIDYMSNTNVNATIWLTQKEMVPYIDLVSIHQGQSDRIRCNVLISTAPVAKEAYARTDDPFLNCVLAQMLAHEVMENLGKNEEQVKGIANRISKTISNQLFIAGVLQPRKEETNMSTQEQPETSTQMNTENTPTKTYEQVMDSPARVKNQEAVDREIDDALGLKLMQLRMSVETYEKLSKYAGQKGIIPKAAVRQIVEQFLNGAPEESEIDQIRMLCIGETARYGLEQFKQLEDLPVGSQARHDKALIIVREITTALGEVGEMVTRYASYKDVLKNANLG